MLFLTPNQHCQSTEGTSRDKSTGKNEAIRYVYLFLSVLLPNRNYFCRCNQNKRPSCHRATTRCHVWWNFIKYCTVLWEITHEKASSKGILWKLLKVNLLTTRLFIDKHTHTHPFNGPFSRTTQVSRYQKGKTNLDFTEAREWVAVASAGTYASLHLAPDRQPRQHPTTQFFTGRMPFLPPNQQCKSTEGTK